MSVEQQLEIHYRQAFLWARQCCAFDEDLAHDVLQESFLKILEGRAAFHGKSSFKTWLFSVIRFTSIDTFRKKTAMRLRLESFPADVALEAEFSKRAMYEEMISRLPQKQAELLLLVFYHDLTIEAAAQVMDISTGTARTHYDRGKKNLKEQIIRSGLRDAV